MEKVEEPPCSQLCACLWRQDEPPLSEVTTSSGGELKALSCKNPSKYLAKICKKKKCKRKHKGTSLTHLHHHQRSMQSITTTARRSGQGRQHVSTNADCKQWIVSLVVTRGHWAPAGALWLQWVADCVKHYTTYIRSWTISKLLVTVSSLW